jgi:hypothetical protein
MVTISMWPQDFQPVWANEGEARAITITAAPIQAKYFFILLPPLDWFV